MVTASPTRQGHPESDAVALAHLMPRLSQLIQQLMLAAACCSSPPQRSCFGRLRCKKVLKHNLSLCQRHTRCSMPHHVAAAAVAVAESRHLGPLRGQSRRDDACPATRSPSGPVGESRCMSPRVAECRRLSQRSQWSRYAASRGVSTPVAAVAAVAPVAECRRVSSHAVEKL